MTSPTIIKNYAWDDIVSREDNWIKKNDGKYIFIKSNLINVTFPSLNTTDQELLTDSLIKILNFIRIKFGFIKNENILWDQLIQNKFLDFRSLVLIMLPFIKDDTSDPNKKKLQKLEDLYTDSQLDDKNMPLYTNIQFNRCVRHSTNGTIEILKRPYLKEYFLDHLEHLLMNIETISNKLYVNWVDILPARMDNFSDTELYKNTVKKIVGKISTSSEGILISERDKEIKTVELINHYIDPNPGLSYQDFYNVMSNHLYHEIKNYKWLIYDVVVNRKIINCLTYLETKIDLEPFWKDFMWSQIDTNARNKFIVQQKNLFESTDPIDNIVSYYLYYSFGKYHVNSKALVESGKLIVDNNPENKDAEEDMKVTSKNARAGMANVPPEEIYLFLYDQLSSFKKSWFYYVIKIKKMDFILSGRIFTDRPYEAENIVYITPKNIYNYCKSMVHFIYKKKFIRMPRHWKSLKPEFIELILIRMLDIEHPTNLWLDIKNPVWFRYGKYIRRFYPFASGQIQTLLLTFYMHKYIRTQIVGIVFESLIYHGLLSYFIPNKNITGNADSTKEYMYKQMEETYFGGKKGENYQKNAYYFLTGTPYSSLGNYFDYLTDWPFMYAMNWVSQINFYKHYTNNRIIYVTGSTGVGKSTQVPKLLLYALKMIDYVPNGKIICTEPRISPTVTNARTISEQMGVPILEYNEIYKKNVPSDNYYIQYKYRDGSHVGNVESFLRIVTDGTLFEQLANMPFLTYSEPDKNIFDSDGKLAEFVQTYSAANRYDIVIIDEAHEHDVYMDMILTLVRDSVYVNNSLRLVIISATMDYDEPLYRRYYRSINDNRLYPLSAFIEKMNLDRSNIDRRIHISPPGATTLYPIDEIYLPKNEADLINEKNFVEYGIAKTIKVANSTTTGDILLFLSGKSDIKKAVAEINVAVPPNIIGLPFYGEMSDEEKTRIGEIDKALKTYTRYKEDIFLEENKVTRRVPAGTYNRAIIIATNIAEASITFVNLKYVVDTGYAKTLIFDPIDGIYKTLILPISQSSSEQRKGRVGRRQAGKVYFLYDKKKIINNRTSYSLANSDVKEIILKLFKSDPRDSFIIDPENDINNINNLEELMDASANSTNVLYTILKNPRPYSAIIEKQYMFIPDPSYPNQYYTYYGKSDPTISTNFTIQNLVSNYREYIKNNHDDYHYQSQHYRFFSRGYTGYDGHVLADETLSFYLIHPDENVILRNPYTGTMLSIKYNTSVSDAYYYYLLEANGIKMDDKTFDQFVKKHDFSNITFESPNLPKYYLALNDLKLKLLVIDIPMEYINMELHIENLDAKNVGEKKFIDEFYSNVQKYYPTDSIITIKSNIMENLNMIQSVVPLNIFENLENLLWYAYSVPYDLQNDVLAIMLLIKTVPDPKQWISPMSSKKEVERFLLLHLNSDGDIGFLWKLWSHIKEIFDKSGLWELAKIDTTAEIKFKMYKDQYLAKVSIPFDTFKILDKMYKSGSLNTEDELSHYLMLTSINLSSLANSTVIDYVNNIAKNNRLDSDKIKSFMMLYLENLYELNKIEWMDKYKANDVNTVNTLNTLDIMEWIKKKFKLPGLTVGPNYVHSKWDRLLETYIRAFSSNLIKNEISYYLQVNKAMPIYPFAWSKKISYEKTFLSGKMQYLIYHSSISDSLKTNILYLTPVKLEWVLELNPIYYFYLFFDKNNVIYSLKTDEYILKTIGLINENRRFFSKTSLLAYLDSINNPTLSKLVHMSLDKQ